MRRRRVLAHLGGAALAQLAALRALADGPAGCGVPAARDDGWPVASIDEEDFLDRGALCGMADRHARIAALAGCATRTHRIVTVRNSRQAPD